MTDLHLKTYFSPLLQPFTSAKENRNRKENVQQHGLVFATTGFLRHSNACNIDYYSIIKCIRKAYQVLDSLHININIRQESMAVRNLVPIKTDFPRILSSFRLQLPFWM